MEMKTQQGGPVRARKSKLRNYNPYIEEQTRSGNKNTRRRGKGSSAAKTFCAVMNLPPPPAKFHRYNGILLESLSKVSDASMKKTVEETVEMNNSNRDITAAFDGSWQKRGHTSLNGVVSETSLETG
ncbi:uncharacterized protein TNCV_4372061 [Trichonephila clavipes]|nr:uncharacterized protein TNCV_4372061 [Trichonephila clavipes]